MSSTLHLLVYLYTISEIPSCCVQLQNTASWVVFHQKRFWGWNNYDQMCLWVNFSKHNTDINHVSSFSTPKPSLKKILIIIIVRFKCLSMDVRNYTFAGVFSSLNWNSVALHPRAEKKRHGSLSTKISLWGWNGYASMFHSVNFPYKIPIISTWKLASLYHHIEVSGRWSCHSPNQFDVYIACNLPHSTRTAFWSTESC